MQRHTVTEFRFNQLMETIGERVRRLREDQKISRAELARAAKIAPTTLSDLELGRSKKTTELHRLAAKLGTTPEWLATGRGPTTPDDTVVVASIEIDTNYVRVPQLDMPAGAGQGGEMDTEPEVVRWLDVAREWADEHFPRRLPHIRVLTTRGDSMTGAGILHGDLLFVDTGVFRYDGDGYYILRFRDGWQVKRLRANVLLQQLEIVSMLATREETHPVGADQESGLLIAGKVAAWWTLMKF